MKSPADGHMGTEEYFCLGVALRTQAMRLEKGAGSVNHAKRLELDPRNKE